VAQPNDPDDGGHSYNAEYGTRLCLVLEERVRRVGRAGLGLGREGRCRLDDCGDRHRMLSEVVVMREVMSDRDRESGKADVGEEGEGRRRGGRRGGRREEKGRERRRGRPREWS